MAKQTNDRLVATVIAHAILNKFNDWKLEVLIHEIEKIRDAVNALNASDPFEQDVRHQLQCFDLIENGWRNRSLNFEYLSELNATARGLNLNDMQLRTEDYVADFGGETPTQAADIKENLHLIESGLAALETLSVDASASKIAKDIAKVASLVIFVHPFPDGNGRTARFLIQLVLRRMGYTYVVIPKYRNDEDWRVTLDKGEDGDWTVMARYIERRMIHLKFEGE
jgi:hypothetical protein